MSAVYRKIFPEVHQELAYWKKRASQIENEELRKQALASIDTKTFHCEGGGIYALLAKKNRKDAIAFIVAFQTISDYLDNLCDRSTSLDPDDFSCLHEAMIDAVTPGRLSGNYYAYRSDQNDSDYLVDLVKKCQEKVSKIKNYDELLPYLIQLVSLYCDLQVHKHVALEERVSRLQSWYEEHKETIPDLTWYEFSACAGSTLGVFCLVSYGLSGLLTKAHIDNIYHSYFPYMQGLHIMLDYYIDQEEDLEEGDLNFCSFYETEQELEQRFLYFMEQAKKYLHVIPHKRFHQLVHNGLIGMYLADKKVKKLNNYRKMVKQLLNVAGFKAKFFYLNTKLYHLIRT